MSDELKEVTQAEADRDALLAALGFKAGPLGHDGRREVILDDATALRPAMVKARREALETQGDRDWLTYLIGEEIHGSRSGLLLRLWNEVKALRRRALAPPASNDAEEEA